MIFKAIILLCASTIAAPDCQRDTATDVVIPRQEATSMQQCLFESQARIGSVSQEMTQGLYPKIICQPAERVR